MQRAVSFIGACAILGFGAYMLFIPLLVAEKFHWNVAFMAVTLIGGGSVWLIGDFILPLLRSDSDDDE